MSATVIDGKQLAANIRQDLKQKFEELASRGKKAGLAVILVGENPASQVYVRNKIKACEEVGIQSFAYYLPETCTQSELHEVIDGLVASKDVHGILVQLPLPRHLDEDAALRRIPANKDVDGFSAENVGKLLLGQPAPIACTPYGVMKMLESANAKLAGKRAVVVGRSNIVGKPMALLLLREHATVTVCHSRTENLKEICQEADVLVAAVGKANLITADMVKPGATVIDVGMNHVDGKLCGDVDYDGVKEVAGAISPVPGGVGPMTITMLLYNTYLAAAEEV